MSKPVILLAHPILEPMGQRLTDVYQVERLWAQDLKALHEGVGKEVEAIVEGGEEKLTPELLLGLPKLKLIACVSVGYDGVDVPWCRAHGIEVTSDPGHNADDVADHAIGLMLAGYRNIVGGHNHVLGGGWKQMGRIRPFGSLTGRTIGVVGLGRIGIGIAKRAEAMGMNVVWWGPRAKDVPWRRYEDLLEMARASDVLAVACRADESTRGLISAEVIAALGDRGMLVNVARGQVVDEDALIAALKSRDLAMAGLDVFAEEPTPADRWQDVPYVVLTPHSAGGAPETVAKLVGQCVENLRRHFAGEPLFSPVRE